MSDVIPQNAGVGVALVATVYCPAGTDTVKLSAFGLALKMLKPTAVTGAGRTMWMYGTGVGVVARSVLMNTASPVPKLVNEVDAVSQTPKELLGPLSPMNWTPLLMSPEGNRV